MKKFILVILALQFYYLHLSAQTVNGIIVSDSANLTLVKVWGTHEDRGFACGYLLGEKISNMVTGYMIPVFGPYLDAARQMVIDGADITFDSVYVHEAVAMIDGMNASGTNTTGIDYIDGLIFNSYLDIAKLLGLSADGPGCSSLMSWGDATTGTGLNGKSVISRHLDWTPNATLIANQVMVIHIPSEEDEQPWAMIGFAGQMSVLSGFNQSLAVFQHMMSDFTANSVHNQEFEPVWLTLRKAIEKSDYNNDGPNNTLDVMDAVNSNSMGYADGFIVTALAPSIAGADSLVALVAELAPQAPLIVFRNNSYPDTIPGDNLYAANYEIKRNNHHHYCNRYYGVMNALGDGTSIGMDENWQIMRDHSNSGSGNIQFMQFIPESDLFRISVHRDGSPAYQKPPVEFAVSEILELPVGLDNYYSDSGILVYPNPVKDQLFINNITDKFGLSVRIFSGDGTLQFSGKLEKEKSAVHVRNLSPGIYFLKIGNKGVARFIKL